jgi:hypothetical protein
MEAGSAKLHTAWQIARKAGPAGRAVVHYARSVRREAGQFPYLQIRVHSRTYRSHRFLQHSSVEFVSKDRDDSRRKGVVMSRYLFRSALLSLTFGLVAAASGELHEEPIRLRFEPGFILEAVAHEMNVVLDPRIPAPEILLESRTPLRLFQDAIAPQWGFRPPLFSNAFVPARNEIYLTDDPRYYAKMKRTLDESLAHEYAHYIQVRYLNADLAEASWENDAIAMQRRFSELHGALPQREAGVVRQGARGS